MFEKIGELKSGEGIYLDEGGNIAIERDHAHLTEATGKELREVILQLKGDINYESTMRNLQRD